MESGIQSSFIPRDAGQPQKIRVAGSGGVGDLLLVLGIVALAASAALAGAVFLYQQYLRSSAASDIAQLKTAEQQFQPALVQQLTRLDDRMRAAQTILSTHIAPSAFFEVLNQVTLKTISYSNLDFQAPDPNHIQVKMQGVAQSVNSIALQDDLMSQSGVFTSPIFSNIDRQKDGVHFDVTALVNPSALSFSQLTGGAASAQPLPQIQQTVQPGPQMTDRSAQQTSLPQQDVEGQAIQQQTSASSTEQ